MQLEENKFAFVIGHTEKDKGAYSEHLKFKSGIYLKTLLMPF